MPKYSEKMGGNQGYSRVFMKERADNYYGGNYGGVQVGSIKITISLFWSGTPLFIQGSANAKSRVLEG